MTHTLLVSLAGDGTGKITSQPAGIDCGVTCTALYDAGPTVSMTAVPATGSSFGGWSGPCSGTSEYAITMNQSESVGALLNTDPVVEVPGLSMPGLFAIAALFASLLVWWRRKLLEPGPHPPVRP